MFNPLKKILHREDTDFDDVRSHVLGDRFESFDAPAPMPMQASPAPSQQGFPPQGLDDFSQKTRDVFGDPFQNQPTPAMQGQRDFERAAEKTNRDYDIMDRLAIIESTLSAIRSQTETINERLKNMEAKLGYRRY